MSDRGRDALAALGRLLDGPGLLHEPEDLAPYLNEPRGRFHGRALAVARPESTEQLAAIVRCCSEHELAMVPQGGRTGLVGGASPINGELIISLERMRRLRSIDPIDTSLVVEAGMPLARVRQIAAEHGLRYPVSLASEGTATIGGTLATNAGGNLTIRYGNTRAQVLGLEAVLPDGRVFSELSPLRKDNSGYDLKQLLIGSEGTLGIITAACLRLAPAPRQGVTAMLATHSLDQGLALLRQLRAELGETLSACEFMPRLALDFVLADQPRARDPFDRVHPWYLVVQVESALAGDWLKPALLNVLESALQGGRIDDAVLAESEQAALDFWALREGISRAQARGGVSLKHDISVPVPRIPDFMQAVLSELERAVPGIRPCVFGHLGDGNLHFNLSQPEGLSGEDFRAREADCNRIVFDQVHAVGGSIAAEHGVGQLRREELARGQARKLELMARVKSALDPAGLMNPGKLMPVRP
ncbi:FAD-binding oxidoreductase [Wenzhouxiangella marina]|uniref:FAD linked oxidase domain protein n=1 Tax=Wenzhouxiangella marina TaxID=1579979 RepID=A0A0K0Y028_9GAMM|nr:FAD-binding oxidoreductase [Wenzhouxiangella marina]AKS43270.1 FAD linked oxidase domain protein [Wenzhouxiangella marina]MBB6087043.1 D-lactate dehydrogenase (cytochrome) [Wenzhouxiangella marina]